MKLKKRKKTLNVNEIQVSAWKRTYSNGVVYDIVYFTYGPDKVDHF